MKLLQEFSELICFCRLPCVTYFNNEKYNNYNDNCFCAKHVQLVSAWARHTTHMHDPRRLGTTHDTYMNDTDAWMPPTFHREEFVMRGSPGNICVHVMAINGTASNLFRILFKRDKLRIHPLFERLLQRNCEYTSSVQTVVTARN